MARKERVQTSVIFSLSTHTNKNSTMTTAAVQLEVGLDGSTYVAPRFLGPQPPAPPAPLCANVECFAKLVRLRAGSHRTVILAMTNAGFAPFWHNLRCSMERHDVSQHAIIIGTDAAACDAAASESVPCVVGDGLLWDDSSAGGSGAGELSQNVERHGTAAYARLMHIKARPALEALRLGYHLIFTNTDVVWLRNPLRELRRGALGRALQAGDIDGAHARTSPSLKHLLRAISP